MQQPARHRECPDREPVARGEHLVVERRSRLRRPPLGVERVVPALVALTVDQALAVLPRREAAPHAHDTAEEVGDTGGRRMVAHARGELEQQGVVVEHALVMRLAPVAPRRVAEEAALHRVAQVARREPGERAGGERPGRGVALEPAAVQHQQDGGDRKLRRSSEPAVLGILVAGELGGRLREGGGDLGDGRRHGTAGAFAGRAEGILQAGGALQHFVALLIPGGDDRVDDVAERGDAALRPWRQVGGREEGATVGRDEHGERPAELLGERARRRHVGRVDFGMLLPVDLDGDDPRGEPLPHRLIGERFAGHHVAPVAGRVADRHQHRNVAPHRLRERLRAPRPPVDRVIGVRAQVRADGVFEPGCHTVSL